MKNKPLIITLIVILSVLTVAVIGFLIALLTNKFNFNFGLDFNHYSDTIILDEYYENKYSLINIKNSLGDVNIIDSEDNKIHIVVYGEEDLLSINEGSSLDIEYQAKACFGFCFNQPSSRIEISIPKDYKEKIKIKSNAGDIDIADFELANIKIEADLGDVKIGNVNDLNITVHAGELDVNRVNRITAKNDLGDLTINHVSEFLDITSNCGDIDISNAMITEDSKLYNALGDITIKNTSDINIDSEVKLGDNNIRKNNSKSDIKLDIENKCGDVEVN